MERRIYQITDRDLRKAAETRRLRERGLAEIESHRADPGYFRRRHTTYGLAKRDSGRLLNAGDPDYYEGRGQGLIDQMLGLPYTDERRTSAYNQGYHAGYLGSLGEMIGYIANNPNFDGLRGE
jgi:hypothetical protein